MAVVAREEVVWVEAEGGIVVWVADVGIGEEGVFWSGVLLFP